ncbi:MAG: hypothetical protein ACI9UV_000753 [Algoriphagus sp.]|jgi:hypothetical protein
MRSYLLTLLLALVFFACSEKEKEITTTNILENLSLSIDTLLIDSKGELFSLRRGYSGQSISDDRKFVFLYNPELSQVQQISLETLSWEKSYDFEVEGPDGISDVVFSVKPLENQQFLITSYQKLAIFDTSGTKIKDLSIPSLPIASDLDELDNGVILSKNHKNLFSLPGTRFVGTRSLAKINLEKSELITFPISELDWVLDLKVVYMGGYSYQEYIYLKDLNDQIMISSPSTSSFYIFDPISDSLTYHSFVHRLSPVNNDQKLQTKVESMEAYEEEMKKFNMGVNFSGLIWDGSSKKYFRFSRKPLTMNDSFGINGSQVFLYAYDQEFNLIGEKELTEISKVPEYPFFKDGKLWSYVSVEDELGFAVFTFNF